MSEKLRLWTLALHQIEKQFGKGSIMRLGEANITDIQVISTVRWPWILPLEWEAFRRRVVEIFGPGLRQDRPCPAHHG